MSEREAGLGSFVLGIAVGVTLGLLFAREDGEVFRGKIVRRLRALRGLAAERAGDLGALVADAASHVQDEPEEDDQPPVRRPKARRRRRPPRK